LIAAGIALAANDRFALKAPNGIEFSQFKGYETWDMVASATSDNAAGYGSSPEPGCIKSILANPVMINAFKAGILCQQTTGEHPRARRARSENGRYVVYAPRPGTSSRSTTAARWSAWATLPRAVAGTSVGRGVRFA
jgi:hypothetical protein